MRTQLAIGFLEPLDLDLQLGALLSDGEAIVAGVEAAELVDDVERKRCDQRGSRR